MVPSFRDISNTTSTTVVATTAASNGIVYGADFMSPSGFDYLSSNGSTGQVNNANGDNNGHNNHLRHNNNDYHLHYYEQLRDKAWSTGTAALPFSRGSDTNNGTIPTNTSFGYGSVLFKPLEIYQ